jgi:hypothetical protein
VSSERAFAAFIAHDGVTLVEHRREQNWVRAVAQWTDLRDAASIDEAVTRLSALLVQTGAKKPRVAIAIEQFGVMHHLMTLPRAANEVIQPIIRRELQRVFGVSDPVVAFTRTETPNAEVKGPQQVVIAAAPSDTVDALRALTPVGTRVEIATVVPKAMHALYELSGASREPTAVLVALESGPHLAFFLDGRLELAIDPPIALEGDRPTVAMILDQLERGAVYFRQQFRGAEASRVLLAAREDEYASIASAIEERMTARVQPLFKGTSSPEAVIAIGAALEARHPSPLDLYPHPPTLRDRAEVFVRGPMRSVTIATAAAVIAFAWGATQVVSLVSANRETNRLHETIAAETPAIAPMRTVAQRRADLVAQAAFVRGGIDERSTLARTLSAIASSASEGISFDTLSVQRSADGWAATIEGTARGATTTQAVFGLDALLKSIRVQHAVSTAALDDFDYPKSADDSLPRSGAPVTIAFHLSFTARRSATEP